MPLLPAIFALVLIVVTKRAILSLFAALLLGVFLITPTDPVRALHSLFEDYLFPILNGSVWNLSAVYFTLILGAFTVVLEKSGGFHALLHRVVYKKTGKNPTPRVLSGIYGLGILCCFDGLANALLLGRIGRPVCDALKIPRQLLAYLVDSTAASVACVAFVSTWIATQLSLIGEGLQDVSLETSPAALFFASIPANPYCLLTLLLVPLVIWRQWLIGPMRWAQPVPLESALGSKKASNSGQAWRALVPLGALILSIPILIYLWQNMAVPENTPAPAPSWTNAMASPAVPYALVAASLFALAVACLCFPKANRKDLPAHLLDGASQLLPALLILLIAWALGRVFKDLGTALLVQKLLSENIALTWLPLVVFLVGTAMSFTTGTSWGTMGLLMPLVLPAAIGLGADATMLPQVIGAVFGGAVFGDHCSPFSDTTIVSSLAAGCSPQSHVLTQLPYAGLAAGFSLLAYTLMALALAPWLATALSAAALASLPFLISVKSDISCEK